MSPRPCTICTRDDHDQIQADLAAGKTIRETAKAHGVSEDALTRCRAAHASAKPDEETKEASTHPLALEPLLSDLPASGLIARLDSEIAAAEADRESRRARAQELARAYVDTRTLEASQALDQANAEIARADALLVGLKSKRAEEAERLRVQLEQEQEQHQARMAEYREERRLRILAQVDAYGALLGSFPERVVEQTYPKLRAALQAVYDAVEEGNALAAEVSKAYSAATDAASQLPFDSERPRIFPPPHREDVVRALLRRVPNMLFDEQLTHAPDYQTCKNLQLTAAIIVPRRIRGPWELRTGSEGIE